MRDLAIIHHNIIFLVTYIYGYTWLHGGLYNTL